MKIQFEFEKARDFGAIITDSLQFFARNFKSFLLGFLTYVGPFLVIGMIAMLAAGKQMLNLMTADSGTSVFPLSFAFLVPSVILATAMVFAFVTAAIQKYQQLPDEPIGQGLWPYIRVNIGPVILAFIIVIVLIAVPMILFVAVASSIGVAGVLIAMFILLPAIIYVMIPLSIFIVLHTLEKNPVGVSLQRAFQLVKDNWWSTFLIYIVISLLASIASYIFVIPAYILLMIQSIGAIESGSFDAETGVWFGILYACAFLGSSFTSMYQILGITLQYYSLREKKEGTGLMRRIEALDKPDEEKFV
jgi:hypothetical protein